MVYIDINLYLNTKYTHDLCVAFHISNFKQYYPDANILGKAFNTTNY